MTAFKLPLLALGCALLLSSAGIAQASSSDNTQKPIINNDKDKPLPIWEPPTGQLSLNANTIKQQLEIYPNPATEKTTIVYTAGDKPTELYVYNLIGKLMTTIMLPEGNDTIEKVIDLSHLPKGYYILKLGEKSLKLSLR